ncbi:MAG: fibronectin type III domain-containing protein [Bacteroidia bacterium]|nr:fibronectin type III domain-containing protein [Bacteroidia bacterium]
MNVSMISRAANLWKFSFVFFLTGLLFVTSRVDAQPQRNCGTMEYLDKQISSDPALRMRMRQIEEDTRLNAKSAFHRVSGKITIPVVIHVVYRTPEENITDQQILSQIKVLNEDFQRLNADRSQTPLEFLSAATNTGISFQLATTDPNGNPTSGIVRYQTTQFAFYSHNNGVKYSAMGGVDAWPTADYLNIWVCNLGMGVLGYAQFPGGPAETDGVVIGYPYFGRIGNVTAPFNKGRTTTHEVGHWLNLRHIWGDGPCDVDDFVEDTPPTDKPNHGCASGHYACGALSMVQNFMDYTDDACMNLFTRGQAERMRTLFAPGGYRRNLLFSKGLQQNTNPATPIAFEPPKELNVTELSETVARLSWSEVEHAESYNARFRRLNATEWSSRNFEQNYVRATGLKPCTDYEFQVETVFEGTGTGFSATKSFQTLGCTSIPVSNGGSFDEAPTGLYASNVFNDQATIHWNEVAGATSYKLQYKPAGSGRVITKVVNTTTTSIFGLSTGTIYLYRVRANFDNTSGPYSATAFFMPGVFASRLRTAGGETEYIQTAINPSDRMLRVQYRLPDAGVMDISILDARGEIVQNYPSFSVRSDVPFELDVNSLRIGNYQLRIADLDGFYHVRDFVIE